MPPLGGLAVVPVASSNMIDEWHLELQFIGASRINTPISRPATIASFLAKQVLS
jgi:hypothetical protein